MRTVVAKHILLPKGLEPEVLSVGTDGVRIFASLEAARPRCPLCGRGFPGAQPLLAYRHRPLQEGTPHTSTVRTDNAPKVRFSATVGWEPEIELALP